MRRFNEQVRVRRCDVLVYVLTRLGSVSLWVLGAYRDGEAADNPALVSTLTD